MTDNTSQNEPAVPDPFSRPTLTAPEVAAILRISRASAFRGIETGQIPSIRIGRRLLVPTAALRTMLCLEPTARTAAAAGDSDSPTTGDASISLSGAKNLRGVRQRHGSEHLECRSSRCRET
jgi:hypothetical protein